MKLNTLLTNISYLATTNNTITTT